MSNQCGDYSQSCLIELRKDLLNIDSLSAPSDIISCCSCLVIDKEIGLILSPASCLSPFFDTDGDITFESIQKELSSIDISVIIKTVAHNERPVDGIHANVSSSSSGLSLFKHKKSKVSSSNFQSHRGRLLHIWKVESFRKCIDCIEATDDGPSLNDSNSNEFSNFVSHFMIIQMVFDEEYMDESWLREHLKTNHQELYRMVIPSSHLRTGDPIRVMATPFGSFNPTIFMNSLNDGIISNIHGSSNVFLMLDSHCVPGSEGGIILCNMFSSRKKIIGLLVTSISWEKYDMMGIGCAMSQILDALYYSLAPSSINEPISGQHDSHMLCSFLDKCPDVCLISAGDTRGTGVIVDRRKGIILTCAHVLNYNKLSKVKVLLVENSLKVSGKVIFCNERDKILDLAVLKVDPSILRAHRTLKLAIPKTGGTCFALGYTSCGLNSNPSLTKGIISNVIQVKNTPVMIQSSCKVLSGASGGALINHCGHFLGILVCNTRDAENFMIYPHINMSIPAIIIWRPLRKYLLTNDPSALESLQLLDRRVNDIWKLNTDDTVESKL